MELHEIVLKLTGPIRAVGETNEDARRLANLKELTGLVEHLFCEIHGASAAANNHQDSMKAIGMYAKNFLKEIRW